MECDCGGVLIEGKTTYRVSRTNFTFILENIPAFRCMRCERVLIEDNTKEKIQKMINRMERDSSEIVTGKPSANLYDY